MSNPSLKNSSGSINQIPPEPPFQRNPNNSNQVLPNQNQLSNLKSSQEQVKFPGIEVNNPMLNANPQGFPNYNQPPNLLSQPPNLPNKMNQNTANNPLFNQNLVNKGPQVASPIIRQENDPTNLKPPNINIIPPNDNKIIVENHAQGMNMHQGKPGGQANPGNFHQNLGNGNQNNFKGVNQLQPTVNKPNQIANQSKPIVNQPPPILNQPPLILNQPPLILNQPRPNEIPGLNQPPNPNQRPPIFSDQKPNISSPGFNLGSQPQVLSGGAQMIPGQKPNNIGGQIINPTGQAPNLGGPPFPQAPQNMYPGNNKNIGEPFIQNAPGGQQKKNPPSQNNSLPPDLNTDPKMFKPDHNPKPNQPFGNNPKDFNPNKEQAPPYSSINQIQDKSSDHKRKSMSPQKHKFPSNPQIGNMTIGKAINQNLNISIPKNAIPQIRKFLPDQIISHLDEILNDIKSILNLNDISLKIDEFKQKLDLLAMKGCIKSKEIIGYILSAYRCVICNNSDIQNIFELRCGDQICMKCLENAASQTEGVHKMKCPCCKVDCDAAQEEKIWMRLGYRKSELENLNLKYKYQSNGSLECKLCKKQKKQFYNYCYHVCKECFAEEVRLTKAPCVTCHEQCNYDEIVNEVFQCSNCEVANYFVGSYGKFIDDEKYVFCINCSYEYFNTSYNNKFNIKLKKLDKVELNDHLFSLCWICNIEVFKGTLVSSNCQHRFCDKHENIESCNLCSN